MNSSSEAPSEANHPVESMSSEWTDEKHSLYLNTMEASFVSQLYSSKDMIASNPQSSRNTQLDNYSAEEFKVLRNGCWQRINFPRVEPQLNRTNKEKSFRRNPWIQHYRSAGQPQVVTPVTVQDSSQPSYETINMNAEGDIPTEPKSSSKSSQAFHTYLCDQEVSDQNFTDETHKEEKGSGVHNLKRLRTCG